ncbi:MAG: tripartite tricarboxylate transporter substrate binding protein [Sheuella sp.]|nr:tripartite tricarboxylate transporter substrate binding protein [Sheuella sp.]
MTNKIIKSPFKSVLIALGLTLSLTAAIQAQTYPDHTVKIVVPYPPGGFNDTLARISSDKLSKLWNQSVVVENKPGGNTTIGNNFVAKSPADGYTMLISPLPFSVLPALYGDKLPYDALKDFQPLILAGSAQNVLAIRNTLPQKTVKDLIEFAKNNPGKLNYGSTGSGSSNHLSMELLMGMTDTKMTHIPYKGSAPAVAALVGGDTDLLFDNIPNIISQIKAGSVTPVAVTGSKRSPLLPNVPTVAEAGVPGFEVNVWFGIQLPANTPKPIVEKINRDLVNIYRTEEVTKRFNDQGVDVVASTPAEFQQLIAKEVAKWGKVVKDANIKIE